MEQRFPRDIAYGLIAEQINGSPFCAPRAVNQWSVLYRIHPGVAAQDEFKHMHHPTLKGMQHDR